MTAHPLEPTEAGVKIVRDDGKTKLNWARQKLQRLRKMKSVAAVNPPDLLKSPPVSSLFRSPDLSHGQHLPPAPLDLASRPTFHPPALSSSSTARQARRIEEKRAENALDPQTIDIHTAPGLDLAHRDPLRPPELLQSSCDLPLRHPVQEVECDQLKAE